MSEQPKGEGFDLPEDLIKALDNYAADNLSDEELQELPENKKRENKRIRKDNLKEIEPELKSPSRMPNPEDIEGIVFNDDDTEERDNLYNLDPELKNLNASKTKEDVSKRAGGSNARKKAAELLDAANKKDEAAKPKKARTRAEIIAEKYPTEIKDAESVGVANPDNLEGKILNFEKDTHTLETSLDKGNKQSQEDLEAHYNEQFEKDVASATSIDDLLAKIDSSKKRGFEGTTPGTYFPKSELKMIIDMVRNNESYDGQKITIEYVTRNFGLREKVAELLEIEEKNKVSEQESEPLPEAPVEIVEEVQEVEDSAENSEFWTAPKPNSKTNKEPEPLPEIPLPPVSSEKPILFVDEEKEEKTPLALHRKAIVDLDDKLTELEKTYTKQPLKFLRKAFGFGNKKISQLEKENEIARNEYGKLFKQAVDEETEREFSRIADLHGNNRERKSYEIIFIDEIPKDILDYYTEVLDFYEDNNGMEKGIDFSVLYKSPKLPQAFQSELSNLLPKIVKGKIAYEVGKKLAAQEDLKIEQLRKISLWKTK